MRVFRSFIVLSILLPFLTRNELVVSSKSLGGHAYLKKYEKVISDLTKTWHTPINYLKSRGYVPETVKYHMGRHTPLDWEGELESINDMFEENQNRLIRQDLAALKSIVLTSAGSGAGEKPPPFVPVKRAGFFGWLKNKIVGLFTGNKPDLGVSLQLEYDLNVLKNSKELEKFEEFEKEIQRDIGNIATKDPIVDELIERFLNNSNENDMNMELISEAARTLKLAPKVPNGTNFKYDDITIESTNHGKNESNTGVTQ